MFCDAVTLASLMAIDARIVFTGNIDGARMHYCIVSEKHFDWRCKVSRLEHSSL
jgi:hypothetical protein